MYICSDQCSFYVVIVYGDDANKVPPHMISQTVSAGTPEIQVSDSLDCGAHLSYEKVSF